MIALQLLQLFVAFLVLASICGCIEVALAWWQRRTAHRGLPHPSLSNDQRIREYQLNERAYRGLR